MTEEIRAAVEAMQGQPGFYIVTDSTTIPFQAMIVMVTKDNLMIALRPSELLLAENFTDAASITGPIMPRFKKSA